MHSLFGRNVLLYYRQAIRYWRTCTNFCMPVWNQLWNPFCEIKLKSARSKGASACISCSAGTYADLTDLGAGPVKSHLFLYEYFLATSVNYNESLKSFCTGSTFCSACWSGSYSSVAGGVSVVGSAYYS